MIADRDRRPAIQRMPNFFGTTRILRANWHRQEKQWNADCHSPLPVELVLGFAIARRRQSWVIVNSPKVELVDLCRDAQRALHVAPPRGEGVADDPCNDAKSVFAGDERRE